MRAILDHPDTTILGAAALLLAGMLACGLLIPPLFGLLLAGIILAGVALLALRFPTPFCVAWLVITAMSLEMTFADLMDDTAYQPTIALVKGMEIGLAGLCAIRFGVTMDPLCPAWAFPLMLTAGLVHGLYPGMTTAESLRSAIGSVTPFVFCFVRVPPSWAEAIIRSVKWCPVIAVVACMPLSLAGIRPLFVDSGGARLAGLGHPAFLANVCLPALYACLIQLYRSGRRGDLRLLIVTFLILVLTGARAPLFYAVAVIGLCLLSLRSTAFAVRDRMILILSALALLPVLFVLAGALGDVRLFNVVTNEATDLSGRDLLWPNFENAAALSPWFGWGAGAGNAVIPPDSMIVKEMHTWAAHNEYLRIGVEGGQVGRTLLIGLFAAWVFARTRPLPASDRRIMRLAFLAYAGHAATDNLLISTPACVMFAFTAAVFARDPPAVGADGEPMRPQKAGAA
ncbi:MAG TPA: O-antigen ligase family protein [Rhodopila sp.]|nr:O-antigen ligase family protein [Rhodopila sp.]